MLWIYAEADLEHHQASTAQAIHGTDIVAHCRVFVDIPVDEKSKMSDARPIRKELLENLSSDCFLRRATLWNIDAVRCDDRSLCQASLEL